MKKICFILPEHWSYAMGGAEFQAKCIIEKLSESKKYKIFYLARNVDRNFVPHGYQLYQIAKNGIIRKYGLFFDVIPLIRILNKISPDIIYQRVGCSYTGISAFYKKNKQCRLIWHIAHDLNVQKYKITKNLKQFNRYIDKRILAYGINNADCIIAQSEAQNKVLQENYNRSADQVIKNFQPAPDFKKKNPSDDKIKVLWVANFKKMKQPDIFIRLAKDVSKINKKIYFTMIGKPAFWDPEYQGALEKMISSVDCLDYLGIKRIDEVNTYIENTDIFVNTSIMEGFPNTFIQAWMRSVPVLSLHVDPDGVLMKHNIGVLAGNYNKLLSSLIDLANDKNKRLKMGDKAHKYSMAHHSFKNINKIIDIFDTV